MASPNNGQPAPPPGYQLDVSPPSGYQLDSLPTEPVVLAPTPDKPAPIHPVLQQVLEENPGLSKNFNAENTAVVYADPKRSQRGLKERGGLEFWPPEGEPIENGGDPGFPTPGLGRNILEIYDDKLKNDPIALKQAIYGDLMHGMSSDPYWKTLRDSFMQNFTSQELKRIGQHQAWWDDVNNDLRDTGKDHHIGDPTFDAYIRGWIADEGQGKAGQKESGNTMYSPKQLQILQTMQDYLKTGKTEEEKKPKKKREGKK